jgi:hypothetical protein
MVDLDFFGGVAVGNRQPFNALGEINIRPGIGLGGIAIKNAQGQPIPATEPGFF